MADLSDSLSLSFLSLCDALFTTIFHFLPMADGFFRFALACRRLRLLGLRAAAWEFSTASFAPSSPNSFMPFSHSLKNLRHLGLSIGPPASEPLVPAIHGPLIGCLAHLDISSSCPLLESFTFSFFAPPHSPSPVVLKDFLIPFIARLRECPKLQRMEIASNCNLAWGIGQIKQLKTLIWRGKIDERGWSENFHGLGQLKSLTLYDFEASTFRVLAQLPLLQRLSLYSPLASEPDVFPSLASLKSLKSLFLAIHDPLPLCCPVLNNLPNLEQLEILAFSIPFNSFAARPLIAIKTLRRLHLRFVSPPSDSSATFDWHILFNLLKQNPQLEYLRLSSAWRIHHKEADSLLLLLRRMIQLKVLSLDDHLLEDAPFRSIYLEETNEGGKIPNRANLMKAMCEGQQWAVEEMENPNDQTAVVDSGHSIPFISNCSIQ